MSTSLQKPSTPIGKAIRPDMHLDERQPWQHVDSIYIDRFLLDACTALNEQDADNARLGLESLQNQCLLHVRFLSELETVLRRYQDEISFEHDEVAFNELVSFLSGVGSSLAGVNHQLGFTYLLEHAEADAALKGGTP